MDAGQPSQTALAAAGYRAAHQVLEHGRIFTDPLALRILGDAGAQAAVRRAREDPRTARMRHFIAARSRFAEDRAAAAIERGTGQVVILGAGLDTYAYRDARDSGVRVFEVDHPATQAWKRGLLERASIAVPDEVAFVPVDFEREQLAGALVAARFDREAAAFFIWLGVVPYLSDAAIDATLAFIGGLPGGGAVVFDYSDPPESLDAAGRARHDALASRVASVGEAITTHFDPAALRERLGKHGFDRVEDLGPAQIAGRYYPRPGPRRRDRGGHLVWASSGDV